MNLDSPVTDLPNVGPIFGKKFQKLGVRTIENLFYHVPSHYLDYSKVTTINKLRANEIFTIHAKIVSITNVASKKGIRMQIGSVEDATGKLMVVWFNQQFLTKTLYPGRLVSLSGKVGFFNKKLCLTSPDFEIIDSEESETVHTGHLIPIYPETAGLSSKWIRRIILTAFKQTLPNLGDFLPDKIRQENSLTTFVDAIEKIHFPKKMEEIEIGKKRLGFNEMLFLQLKSIERKIKWKKNKVTKKLTLIDSSMNRFIESLPFELTASQKKAVDEILNDLGKETPMNRLLEGDVGSGKTVVAAVGAFASYINGYQSIFMAPTQILAEQHYKTLIQLFNNSGVHTSVINPIKIELITASTKLKNKEEGRTDIYVGTHSLIHSKINLRGVAYVVIDEQHRFGVEQRTHLAQKSGIPHVLTMTATPIPRTIALTTYGDLELSVLSEVPKGRQKITTWFVPDTKRKGAYEWINKKVMKDKSQVFVVCPLIEVSEKETMEGVKAASAEFAVLKSQFRNLKLGLLHGKMKPSEKNKILDEFRAGKIDILVATPVVEVGIDIPNATIMVIEAAERFGLAQLHQLRGRVGRGSKKSYCLLFSNIKYSKRLSAMEKMHSGFELAELDLKLRGPGEIFGTAQSGFAELKIAGWGDVELIKKTKDIAEDVFKNPKKYPILEAYLEKVAETN